MIGINFYELEKRPRGRFFLLDISMISYYTTQARNRTNKEKHAGRYHNGKITVAGNETV